MTQELNVESAFPTPIYCVDGYDFDKDNEKKLLDESLLYCHQNVGGNFTSTNHYVLENDYMYDIKSYLLYHVKNYGYNVLKMPKTIEFYITQSWINVNHSETHHHPHKHANSLFSGTYYIKGKTPIVFYKQREVFQNFEFDHDELNEFNSKEFHVDIKPGRLVLFPSTLQHQVPTNKEKDQRISLSFNVFFKGNLKPKTDENTKLRI